MNDTNKEAKLPSTPVEVLDFSTIELRLAISEIVSSAELSGEWTYPYKDAATALEEMTLTDMAYWVYKCTNPITEMEEGKQAQHLLVTDKSIVILPEGFIKQTSLTLAAAGDLLRADGLEQSKDILFENVSDLLFNQDISFANFESPVTKQKLVKEVIGDKSAPIECSNREQFDILTQHKGNRFTVMNTSNNHMLDMGIEGIETTLKAFSEEHILDVGTNHSLNEFGKGKTLIKNGIRVGFVSATFGLNGHQLPEGEEYRINTAKLLPKAAEPELDILKQQIDDCKKQNCDFIIASMHWGFEFEMMPRPQQIEATHILVEYGADAIISHHPHVIQPVEYYRTQRDPNRIAPIAYSLGSLTWGFTAPHLVLSIIQNLTLTKGFIGGKELTYVEKAAVTPVFRSVISNGDEMVTRIEKLSDHLTESPHPQEYIRQIKQYADLII